MTPEQYERMREIFLEAMEKDPAELDSFLSKACGGDQELRGEVESLLANDSETDAFLGKPALGSGFALGNPESIAEESDSEAGINDKGRPMPSQIGTFRIVRRLGEGGMGVVYEAEQQMPRRPVALKVIRGGHSVSELHIKLFQREVQALARLKHPGIASIYEAGCTDDGQHYFAMELVSGVRLTEFANGTGRDGRRMSLTERLRLFCKVCDAINYAHQRGIIHRDLKPSNILASEKDSSKSGSSSSFAGPEVKVLDFGLARITDGDAAATTLVTETGRILGTLRYMSPEQAQGKPDAVDVRSDVYSLGAILYELVTGEGLFNNDRGLPHEVLKQIIEDDPVSPGAVNRELRGDLETIVLKAIEKDPSRRYSSAAALAEDIERYLDNQPIYARPASAGYQLRKMVARHKLPFVFATVLTIVVSLFTVYTAIQSQVIAKERDDAIQSKENERTARVEAEKARDLAETEAEKSRRIQAFLQNMLESADPKIAKGRDTELLKDLLSDAAGKIDKELADQPAVAAAAHRTVGMTYKGLGFYEVAEKHLQKALQLSETEYGTDSVEVSDVLEDLASVYMRLGAYDVVEPMYRRALSIREKHFGRGDLETLIAVSELGRLLVQVNDFEGAEPLLREALEKRQAILGDNHPNVIVSKVYLAELLDAKGDFAGAEELFNQVLKNKRETLDGNDPDLATAILEEAAILEKLARFEEAEQLFREALEIRERILDEGHPDLARSYEALGSLLYHRGNYADAEPLLLRAVEIRREKLGEESLFVAKTLAELGLLFSKRGDYEKAEEHLRESLRIYEKVHGQKHAAVIIARSNLANLLLKTGRFEEAEPMYREIVAAFKEVNGENHPGYAALSGNYAMILGRLGKNKEAEVLLREAYELRRKLLGDEHTSVAISCTTLADCLQRQERYEEAEEYLVQGLVIFRKVAGDEHPNTTLAMTRLGLLYGDMGRVDESLKYLKESLEIQRKTLPEGHPYRNVTLTGFSAYLAKDDTRIDPEYAKGALSEFLNTLDSENERDRKKIPSVKTSIGNYLIKQSAVEEAERYLTEAFEMLSTFSPDQTVEKDKDRCKQCLVALYKAWGKKELAVKWQKGE